MDNKIYSNQVGTFIINNYNDNILENNSKKYIFDFESLYLKIKHKKNRNEKDLNEYYCNLLMLFYKQITPIGKINLLRFLYSFNINSSDDNYKYYIFKKLVKILKKLKRQDIEEKKFSNIIDIFLEQGKFFYDKGNNFYSYRFLYNDLYREDQNIKNLRHEIKEKMFQQKKVLKEKFMILNQKDYKDIFSKLKEILKNEINEETNEMFYLVNNSWLHNAIFFIKNILSFKLYEFKKRLNEEFVLSKIYQKYFGGNNNYEISYPYPGQVDNYSISNFYDIWKDPLNEDENYILKENISFAKDYSLTNEKNWNFINEWFGSTNIIKRKRHNLQLIKFKVVILDKRISENNKNLLKPKYIQTKWKINIKEFKEKILRCVNYMLKNKEDTNINEKDRKKFNLMNNNNYYFKNYINNENIIDQRNINFFKIKKANKTLLIELFTAYINDIHPYESIFIEKLDLTDENNLGEIFNKYNKSKDILIIELYENDTAPFLCSKDYDNKGLYKCFICGSKISFKERYNCERCNYSIYCSKKCSELISPINIIHNKLHEKLKEYQKEVSKSDLSPNKNNNLVGLKNSGNTCFINSSLQCLFHNKDLSNYFLNNLYKKEINIENSQGSKGLIAEEFANLLKEMQSTTSSELNPKNNLRTFLKINKPLSDGKQHDAQEFLSLLLDNLHEDLNRINKKPHFEIEEQKGNETDKEASERFWNLHKKREDSIIVDLFHGQFKSKISCLDCGNKSIKYEPFIFLELPIPEKKNRMVIKFIFMNKLEYFGFDLKENSTVLDLKKKAVEHMKMCGHNKNERNEELYNNIEFVLMDQNKIIKVIYNDKNKLNNNELIYNVLNENKSYELVLYEKKIYKDYFNIYVYPIKQDNYDTSSYPISLTVTGDMNFKEIIIENKKKILNMYINVSENDIIKVGILHQKNDSLAYYIKNIFDSREYCPICNNSQENYCKLNDNIKLEYLFNKFKTYIPLLFVMGVSNKEISRRNMKISENLENGIFFLNDCLNSFCEEELLNKGNKWNCDKCKINNKAKKQMKLYRMPKYLIIQLKKFENKVTFLNSINVKKKEDFIKYPINNLDLSQFTENEEEKKYRYDLDSVIQHHGTINEGHYTSICNINENWVLFNDSKHYKIDNPITNDAYILFYKRSE